MFLDDIIFRQNNLNKIALIDRNTDISYNDLCSKSLKLTTFIQKNHFIKKKKIIILLDQSINALVAIFAILKAGSTYIPLDRTLPSEKLNKIIDIVDPDLIITDEEMVERVYRENLSFMLFESPKLFTQKNIFNYTYNNDIDFALIERNMSNRNEMDLAYMIFTSGTTGEPKGVMIEHRSVLNYISQINHIAGYSDSSVFLNIPPLHFDAHLIGYFCMLLAGGTTVILNKFNFPNEIVNLLKQYNVTDVTLIPTVMKMLTSRFCSFLNTELPCLRSIMFGAETCSIEVLKKIKASFSKIKFIHGYGPTECTCGVIYKVFNEIPEEIINGNISMGKPLENTYVYALNSDGDLIRSNEEGELYIGGIQLMRGYFNNKKLTDDVLINDKFNLDKKVYKTGDFVTKNSTDEYFFIGRKDDLLKVHGMIVRLSEIKSKILEIDNVLDAILVPHDEGDIKYIYGFITLKDHKQELSKTEVINYLLQKLNHYSMPKDIFIIDNNELPYKNNGKIDEKKLLEKFIN